VLVQVKDNTANKQFTDKTQALINQLKQLLETKLECLKKLIESDKKYEGTLP